MLQNYSHLHICDDHQQFTTNYLRASRGSNQRIVLETFWTDLYVA